MTRPADTGLFVKRAVLCALLGLTTLMLPSCGKEEEQSKATTNIAPAPPPPRSALEDIRLNPKVEFPESQEPSSAEIAEAVAEFAAAFATGSASAAGDYMMPADKAVLQQLRESGQWQDETGDIELVRVVSLTEDQATGSLKIGLGVQSGDGAYLLGWQGVNDGGRWRFTALPIDPKSAPNARALDGIDLASLGSF